MDERKKMDLEAEDEISVEVPVETDITLKDTPKGVFEIGEIPELRKANRKVFRMSDGSHKAVFYPEAVHVFNAETSEFDDVDHTLSQDEDCKHFRNEKNGFSAKFNSEESNDELFAIEKDSHSVVVSVKRNKRMINKGVVPSLKKAHHTGKMGVPHKDALLFADIESGTDMEYTVNGNGVKENIIVKEKADVYRYSFILDCNNVVAEHIEDEKKVKFVDSTTGEEVFFIPAPFMVDAAGVVSNDVSYEVKHISENKYSFAVMADSEWINAEDRILPVTIDPQINISGTSQMSSFSWIDGNMTETASHIVGTISGETTDANRMYLQFEMPELPNNPRIKKAEMNLVQSASNIECGIHHKLGLFEVTEDIATGVCTPAHSENLIDYEVMKDGADSVYTFDITSIADKITAGETDNGKLVLMMLDEDDSCGDNVTICGSGDSSNAPTICITYESNYGVNNSYRTHTHELGRMGQGTVDLQSGNLMLDAEDFAWAGNRMPVTLRHMYNSALAAHQYTRNSNIQLNTADFSAMKIGNGWKLNVMQSIKAHTFMHEGVEYSGYVFIDETGAETYFKRSEKQDWNEERAVCYYLYESIDDSTTLYDPYKKELVNGSETKLFDSAGRLIKITDEFGNHMDITFTSGRITSVTDGAGRDFGFAYDASNHLTSITAPDGTSIVYTYSGDYLYSITYPEGQKVVINNTSNKPVCIMLCDSEGEILSNVIYQFKNGRVSYVLENGFKDGQIVTGMKNLFSYSAASRKTVVQTVEPADSEEGETEDKITNTVYTFDYDGNIIDEYMYASEADKFGVTGETDVHSNSGVVSNINNLLLNHSFKTLDDWNGESGNDTNTRITSYAYESSAKFGKHVLRINSTNKECIDNGVCQDTITLPAGEYTFSAYMRVVSAYTGTDTPGAFIRVTKTDGTVLAESEHLSKYDSEFTRLIAPFVIEEAMSVRVHILTNGKGTAYADAVQLEKNAFANEYNLLVNGNFEHETEGWVTYAEGVTVSDETSFNMSRSLKIVGDLASSRQAYQEIAVKTGRSTRETFTLSGWAKGYGITDREREGCLTPQFRLRAEVKYYDSYYKEYGTETYTADFSPCTDEWQMASVQFAKEKYRIIQYVRVYCDYSYNFGVAYFDDIQVVRNSIEQYLSAEDFVVEDYDNAEAEGEDTNVTEDTAASFEELKDAFGNALTETTFTDGEFGTIYRSFEYSSDASNVGNDLIAEKDARGNTTGYTVDEETSRNEVVTDRCGNKTEYEYDEAGRTTKVTSKNSEGTELANVSYEYDVFNNLTEITRGDGMKYAMAYNAFHNLESIGVDGMADPLVKYTYKNGSGRLKAVTYANGHTMKATYNNLGQMVAERWYDEADMLVAYYKYVYDGQGNIVRSIDFVANKEYTYTYEEGRIIRAAESDISVNASEIITSKALVNAILYTYDKEGTLTKKRIIPTGGTAQTVYYETTDDNTVVKFTAGGKQVTSHSKTDSFGRKVFDELQLGTGFVSRQFTYHTGKATDEHKENGKLKSSPTTQLVKEISFSDGRTLVYEYDAEERITKVTDTIVVDDEPVVTVTQYTYDALGQLLTETVNGEVVTEMTYDNYGNILTKNGKVYTYGDSVWKDRLTAFDGNAITYDNQGNPTTYLGHTLTWEKGRQLKSFDDITYTYNANGIRTSKTVDGVKHTYTLDGTKILRETWGDNTLVPVYDNEDSVCGIIYNDTPYYFQKNLQGDIIAITDGDGDIAARYSYDAWGVCTVEESNCEIGEVNPFRYRGYYFDTETGLYYLQSRYYNSNIGRFVNADSSSVLNMHHRCIIQNNIYAYCLNSPTNNIDIYGYFSFKAVLIAGIAGGIWCYSKYIIKNIWSFSLKSAFKEFVVGFITGALLVALVQMPKAVAGGLIGAVFEVISYVGNCIGRGIELSASVLLQKALVGFSMGILTNAVKAVVGKLGFSYTKLKSNKIGIAPIIYGFLSAVAKGHLTKFFSL